MPPGRCSRLESEGRKGVTPAVLIGKDTRISGYMLEAALEAGLLAAGVDVYCHRAAADAGGRLSHPRLAAVGRHRDQRIAQSVRRQRHQVLLGRRHQAARHGRAGDRGRDGRADRRASRSEQLGKAYRVERRAGRYIEFCKSTFPSDADLQGLQDRGRLRPRCGAITSLRPCSTSSVRRSSRSATEPDGVNINAERGRDSPELPAARGAAARRRLRHCARRRCRPPADGRQQGRAYDGDQLLYLIVQRLRAARSRRRRRGRHADEQPRLRAGARAHAASRSSVPRSATVTCWR